MIAFHFPPLVGSSGIQRTLRFVQHLPTLGWDPLVLTVHSRAYEEMSDHMLADVPAGTVVHRAMAFDTARHFQIRGRYLGWMARPDRWVSWKYFAVRKGLKLIEAFKPDVIWSTYPIATAHVIASALHRKTGIPWIADFRDPMAQPGYPSDPSTWRSYLAIEADALEHARFCVFTTPSAACAYQKLYPASASRIRVVENGYDEESFLSSERTADCPQRAPEEAGPLVLLHSGIVYPMERDPTHFFVALARLQQEGQLSPSDLRIRFRAAVHETLLHQLAMVHGVADFIEIRPAIPYREALAEMMSVDALLVMQASNCNAQIPAKIYEYLRAGKPILALTDPAGDTAGVIRAAGLDSVVRLDSVDDIARLLPALIRNWRQGQGRLPLASAVKQASRLGRSQVLAALLGQASTANLPSFSV
ncbi:MAG: glycosyltransferase [Candidatus Saccharibacteria bacterium]|nr:glycosyltransferase [Rhodoferax sp.]